MTLLWDFGFSELNFNFDFHQFLLLFIDIFKTLESVTTLSSYFKANTELQSPLPKFYQIQIINNKQHPLCPTWNIYPHSNKVLHYIISYQLILYATYQILHLEHENRMIMTTTIRITMTKNIKTNRPILKIQIQIMAFAFKCFSEWLLSF